MFTNYGSEGLWFDSTWLHSPSLLQSGTFAPFYLGKHSESRAFINFKPLAMLAFYSIFIQRSGAQSGAPQTF